MTARTATWFIAGFVGGLLGCAGSSTTVVATSPSSPPNANVVASSPPEVAVDPPPEVAACDPFANLVERRERDLIVPAEPRPIRPDFFGRLRHHADGVLTLGSPRTWFGPPVPTFVPLYEGTSELHLLEPTPDGFVAVYRDPYGAGSCRLSESVNCRVVIVGYERCGAKRWSHDLATVMSRPDHLEVQDVRVADHVIYFNEACQSYSREAGGRCSSLVAFDPETSRILWRTPSLVSNNRILVLERYVVAAYGFLGEQHEVALVRRRDGVIVDRHTLAASHEDLTLEGEHTLAVRSYPAVFERFRLDGLDRDSAAIVPVGDAPSERD